MNETCGCQECSGCEQKCACGACKCDPCKCAEPKKKKAKKPKKA